ncbi:hypothetical protein CO179_04615 [candidate division WWE3 bacterium CG_4_9_14_3_um_filter_39_7]|uniref:Uncharacterized protein n=1 Tax=candidate division WWE3 bacterium CG_4_9_14_3_um_filter_39_7 TaxID=1975080 RepID=A0A2M7X0R3_UNCKA|nr:MAG: hypothetical protein CO179_04615 [candidate division WWE3 bacterium CG_4_9_14_3_um_filter_39_7]
MGLTKRNSFKGEEVLNIPLTRKEAEDILTKITAKQTVDPNDLVRFLEYVRKHADFSISTASTNQNTSEE